MCCSRKFACKVSVSVNKGFLIVMSWSFRLQVFEALTEIAFEPEMLPTRLEKERRAVLAEAQMMNTIEYRVDCQLLTNLHAENLLGSRFPIGSTDQVLGPRHVPL